MDAAPLPRGTSRKGMKIIEYIGTRSTWDEAVRVRIAPRLDMIPITPCCSKPATAPSSMRHSRATPRASSITAARRTARRSSTKRPRLTSTPSAPYKKAKELTDDYKLSVDGRVSKRAREAMACRCGAPRCRGTMLALPKKKEAFQVADRSCRRSADDHANRATASRRFAATVTATCIAISTQIGSVTGVAAIILRVTLAVGIPLIGGVVLAHPAAGVGGRRRRVVRHAERQAPRAPYVLAPCSQVRIGIIAGGTL